MRAVLVALVVAAVSVGVAYDGGFDADPQWAFAAIAGAAGVAALGRLRSTARVLLSPAVLVLLALAALQAVSAAWTIAAPDDAFRAAAVTGGYAALAVATAVAAMRPAWVAALLAAAAFLTALSGLVSAAVFSTAAAERIEGGWRPEGPFGYPPALALVQVFAFPALLGAMTRARPWMATLAAGASAAAAGTLVLTVNRLALGMAVLVLALALAFPERTVGVRRVAVAWATILLVAAGLAFHEVMGQWTPRHADVEPGRMVGLVLIVAGACVLWFLARTDLGDTAARTRRPLRVSRRTVAAAATVVAVAVLAGLFSGGAFSARRFESDQSFTHGRTWMWSAAYRAALDRPLEGYGANAFFPATVSRQPGNGRLTRFAHDLPLEQWVETGIGGLLLALALYVAVAAALWRARGSPAIWLLGPAVAAFMLANLVDWPWHLAGVGALCAVALGPLLTAARG